MSVRTLAFIALGAATVALAAAPQLARSSQERAQLGALNINEGIYVDRTGYGVIRGSVNADPTAQLMKLGAQEVKEGAIIFRAADKLYLIDADPKAKSLYTGWAAEAFFDAKP